MGSVRSRTSTAARVRDSLMVATKNPRLGWNSTELVGSQACQRLAYRGSRRAQLLGDVGLVQPVAGRQRTACDLSPEAAVDRIDDRMAG